MMVADVAHKESAVRSAAAEALAEAVQEHSGFLQKTLDSLLDLYAQKNHVSKSVLYFNNCCLKREHG
jgi:HEAT repeat protein